MHNLPIHAQSRVAYPFVAEIELHALKVVVSGPQPFTRKGGHHPASRRWGNDKSSWKLRLHQTIPVVGSDRPCFALRAKTKQPTHSVVRSAVHGVPAV
jgi:hypothetical protein